MSKIDEYNAIKGLYEDYIERLNWCMGKFPEETDNKFDPAKSSIKFLPNIGNDIPNITFVAQYGYKEFTMPFSAVSDVIKKAITDALNMYLPEIIPAAQKLLRAEIDRARDEAKDEVREIMGDIGCNDDCPCKIEKLDP